MATAINSLQDKSGARNESIAKRRRGNKKNKRRNKLAKLRGTLQVGDTFRPFTEKGKFLFNNCPVIDEVMTCPAISHGEKLVLGFLMRRQGKKGESFPSAQNVAEGIGTKERQAERFLRGLRELRFVKIQSRRNPNNPMRNSSNLYEFVWHPLYGLEHKEIREMTREHLIALVGSHPVTNDASHAVINDAMRPSQMTGKDHHHEDPPFKDLHESIRKRAKPKESNARSAEDREKQPASNRKKPNKAFLKTIDDEKAKDAIKRAPLEDSAAEFRQRLAERTHKNANTGAVIPPDHIFELVQRDLDGCPFGRLLALDDEKTTGTPANPEGYYRSLAQQCCDGWKVEQREAVAAKLREMREGQIRKPCPLQRCSGTGEIRDRPWVQPCECEAGQKLSPQVLELFEQLNTRTRLRLNAGLSATPSVEELAANRGNPLFDMAAERRAAVGGVQAA